MFATENLVPQAVEESSGQTQDPVAPDISSVARAASVYSAAVEGELNPDELEAIQILAEKVRTAVSEFLDQPDLKSAENVSDVVVSNPEMVQGLTVRVERAVSEVLILPATESEIADNTNPPVIEKVPAPEDLISLERISQGVLSNDSTVLEETQESPTGDFRVAPAAPAGQNLPVQGNVQVEASDDTVVAVNLRNRVNSVPTALPNVPAVEDATAEHLENDSSVLSLQESVNRPKPVAINQEQTTATDNVPGVNPVSTDEALQIESPAPATIPQRGSADPSPILSSPKVPVAGTPPNLPNAQTQKVEAETPVTDPVSPVNSVRDAEVTPSDSQERVNGLPEQTVSGQSSFQSPVPQVPSGPIPPNDLFAKETATVNPENIRDRNELVSAIVDSEFASEAKKIFSEPKVIRTVADLADFILERLQEIIAAKQLQQKFSSPRVSDI